MRKALEAEALACPGAMRMEGMRGFIWGKLAMQCVGGLLPK